MSTSLAASDGRNRLGTDGGVEDEHQVLVEEQMACRARARKFYLETKRRRKALEERRRQWDVQEERLRQTVLQQRRQMVQDATERFQRAHLPPSQRRRQPFRTSTPNIEEALNHIEGTFSSYVRQSSFLSSSSTISRSCSPSPKPPAGPNPSRHQRALSAADAYAKLMQERNAHSLRNSQALFLCELQEVQARDREASSPQDLHVTQTPHSESLSSLDSLENEDADRNSTTNIASSSSSLDQFQVWDFEKPQLAQKNMAAFCLPPDRTLTLSSTKTFSSDSLLQQSKAYSSHAPPSPGQEEPEEPKKSQNPPTSTGGPNFTGKSLNAEATPPHSLLALCGITGAQTEDYYQTSQENSPSDTITALTRSKATPDNAPLEFSGLTQDGKLDYRHSTDREDRYSYFKHPSATKVILHGKNYNHKDVSGETRGDKDETVARQPATETTVQSHKSNDAMNNLNKGPEPITDRYRHRPTGPVNQTCKANLHVRSDAPECLNRPEEKTPADLSSGDVTCGSESKINDVRFIRGILKKHSKYVSGDAKAKYGAGHLIFTKQVALSIRDSVELTRMKAKDEEGNKAAKKKKLRWFDEVNPDDEEKELNTNAVTQYHMNGKSAPPPQHKSPSSADHQQGVTVAPGGPGATPPASTGYHFTKQAWTDAGVPDGRPRVQGEEVRVRRGGGARTGGPRAPPLRVRSARVGPGPVSSRSRKGVVVRPQSASEARSQGKVMAPRPPPRGGDAVEGGTVETSGHGAGSPPAADPPAERALCWDHSDRSAPPPSYARPSPEGPYRGTESRGGGGGGGAPPCEERGRPRLDHTPTDEEIAQLWRGVRSALATKDARANLSRVTINGDSLVGGVKAVTRMGGFFLSPSNARNLVRRQQAPDSGAARRRGLEPGAGARRIPLPTQTTFQMTPCPGQYDLTQLDEGPESAAHFRPAEPDADPEPTRTPHRQHQGATALSLEEQKVLLSLDRLNHRLQYVRDFVGGQANGVLPVDMPYAGEGKANLKQRGASADSRLRTQRRL